MERIFQVTGMSCAGCAARVEKSVSALPGVSKVQVNLLAKSMKVSAEGVSDAEIAAAVQRIGFHAEAEQPAAPPRPTPQAASPGKRAAYSALLLAPLAAAHFSLPHGALSAWVQLALALPIVWLNRAYFTKGIKALRHGGPSMDTLVALGAGVALADGLAHLALHTPGAVFFESVGMILAFVSIGKWLESRATRHTGHAIERLSSLLPDTATVLRGGEEEVVPAATLRPGDQVLVRPGERISADGSVLAGASAADEAALTGESMPVEKAPGAHVFAGTVNQHGSLRIRVTCARADCALSGVIRLVRDAAADKAPMARLADRVAAVFVPLVLGLACLTAIIWAAAGESWDFALARAVAVLVISCPCALGLATPVAIMAGAGRGAEEGILFRSGAAMEAAGRTDCVLMDKTGTLTLGEPSVTDVLPQGISREELLQLAAALEADANHPLAKAIRKIAPTPLYAAGHTYLPGRGVCATVQGAPCAAGNAAYMHELGVEVQESRALMEEGKTLIHIARAGQWAGSLAIADTPHPTAAAAVQALRALGLSVSMLTGDATRTARAIAAQVGIDSVHAEMQPADKEALVRQFQSKNHRVAMVGDGINDAPALTRADVGIAIGAGTDVAIESADIILMHSDPMDIPRAIRLSRAILRKIRQNLFLAFIYNILAIPLAAGVFYHPFGILLPPAVSALAMGLSSLSVTLNAWQISKHRDSGRK